MMICQKIRTNLFFLIILTYFTPIGGLSAQEMHPLDVRFQNKLNFEGTNLEMIRNTEEARQAWLNEMEGWRQLLMKDLPESMKSDFRISQQAWKVNLSKEEAFLFSDREHLRSSIGREGEISIQLGLMQKVRSRALELKQWHGWLGVKP